MTTAVPTPVDPAAGGGPGRGVWLVARQEFRLRLRAGRWRRLLAIWFLVLLAVTALLVSAASSAFVGLRADGSAVPLGPVVFGFQVLFLLSLALLVVPALAAQSINGDRDRGTLATVQVTLLRPVEITLGKFVAAWGTALVFLAVSLPVVAWSVALGGVGMGRALVVLALVALLLGVVAAVSLALSALLVRTTMSAVLAYLAVFTLCVGTLIVFGLVSTATAETRPVSYEVPQWDDENNAQFDDRGNPIAPDRIVIETFDETVLRTDRTWWLLAPNPFVIVADAAPALPAVTDPRTGREIRSGDLDPLGSIQQGVRDARRGPGEPGIPRNYPDPAGQQVDRSAALWPWGLGVDLVLAAGALWLTARRLRAPVRALPRGSRIA